MQLGDYVEARQLSLETLKIYERLGSHHTIAIALANVAQSSEMLKEFEMAREYYEKALEHYREVGNVSDTTMIEVMLSSVELQTNDSDKGWARILQSLETVRTNPNRPLVLDIITTLSEYVFTDQPEMCAELLTCVEHHPSAWGRTRKKAVDLLSVVKSCLPEPTCRAAVERGRSLDPLDAAGQLLERFSP
jgi:tetratricopeptide (TPR) repeat protein